MSQQVRVDIIMGLPGSGKTTLIRQLLKSVPDGGPVALWDGTSIAPIGGLAGLPGRMLYEAENTAGLDRSAVLGNLLCGIGYVGTVVAVVDGPSFARKPVAELDHETVRNAPVVFLNRTGGMAAIERAELLRAVWAVNPRATVLVDPLDGLNLWRVLDASPPPRLPADTPCDSK